MPPGGVRIENVKGQGGHVRRTFLTHAANVVERAGLARYPLRGHASPSAPGMLGSPAVGPYIENRMFERLQIDLNHELSFLLG